MPDLFGKSYSSVLFSGTDQNTGWISIRPGGFGGSTIFTSYEIQLNEKVQVLEAFRDKVHVYAFGKAAGSANLSGMMFAACSNPSLNNSSRMTSTYNTQMRAGSSAATTGLAGTAAAVEDVITFADRFSASSASATAERSSGSSGQVGGGNQSMAFVSGPGSMLQQGVVVSMSFSQEAQYPQLLRFTISMILVGNSGSSSNPS